MKKMKKMKKILMTALMMFLVVPLVYAQDLTYSNTGWKSVGENEVQLKTEMMDIQTAEQQGGITLPANFSIRDNTVYNNATAAQDAAAGKYSYETIGGRAITYDTILDAGEHQIPGTISLKWKNAATLNDGTLCDVTMTIDNIFVKNNQNTKAPIALLLSEKGTGVQASIFYSRYIEGYNEEIGASYDVTFKVTKAGTDENVNKNMAFAFQDMDIPDRLNGNAYNSPYAEGVTLISGIKDKIYLASDYTLTISNTEYGANTNFVGTVNTPNVVNGKYNIEGMRKAGFITLVDSNEFKFKWHGSTCRTGITGITPSKVITTTSGTHKAHAHITETDNEVLWKEDKTIEMTADSGYIVSKVTVDGKEIEFTRDANGKVTYTFEDVTEDHTIDVQVEPKPADPVIVKVPKTSAFISAVAIVAAVAAISVSAFVLIKETKQKK